MESIYECFDSTIEGLNPKKVEKNRKKYGINELKEKARKSKARVFLEQFQDLLVIILIISAIISIFIGEIESTIVIFTVITINAILGTYQYFKAEKSLESLKLLSSPTANVIRNGEVQKIKSNELVCGDVVIVHAGDMISADGRIIIEEDFEVNESALTGESLPSSKHNNLLTEDVNLGDQKNMVFSGTFCVKGHAKYLVCSTGMNTEIGKIAEMLSSVETKKTPLQNSLDVFSKYLAIIIILICVLVFIMGVYKNHPILESLMFSVALAVAAIPEALSTIVVIVLAVGTEKMAKEKAIIKDLKAVEGLGCVSIICSDKTGTLTMNQMEVRDVWHFMNDEKFNEHVLYSTNYDAFQVINNNPTESALIKHVGCTKNCLSGTKVQEIAFSSNRKMMSNLYKHSDETVLYCKGAVEVILDKCQYIHDVAKRPLTMNDQLMIERDMKKFASEGKRVLAFAYKKIDNKQKVTEDDEDGLIFTGMVALVDPPRLQSKGAIEKCLLAGIKPIMLTGDHKETAVAIAREVGIFKSGDECVTGKQLDNMNDIELDTKINNVTVYSRLTPHHKIRIVKAWQKKNQIVAMTGDGINDAPALKQSDISIAMGMGTEVAKDASSIILLDDNFETIIGAVSNGRKVYQNIQNAIRFLLSGNFAGILIVVYASLCNLPVPFVAVHLLFINLITDGIPAIAIGTSNSQDDLLNKPPRKSNEHFLNKRLILTIALEGILIGGCCLACYYTGLKVSVGCARTMTFASLCLARLFHSLNCATKQSFLTNSNKNIYLYISLLLGIALITAVLLVPYLRGVFVVTELTMEQIVLIYAYSLLPTLIIQIMKLMRGK